MVFCSEKISSYIKLCTKEQNKVKIKQLHQQIHLRISYETNIQYIYTRGHLHTVCADSIYTYD